MDAGCNGVAGAGISGLSPCHGVAWSTAALSGNRHSIGVEGAAGGPTVERPDASGMWAVE
jgi:hypothetical protein